MNIYGIKDSANMTVKYKSGAKKGKVFLYSDYATVATNEWSSEQVYAKSKNVNAIRWDFGRNSTLKVDMEIFDLQWVAMLFGTEFVSGAKDILKREVLKVENGKATITGTPVTGSMSVFVLDNDGLTNTKELTVVEGENEVVTGTYKLAEKEISVFDTDLGENKQIVLFYLENKAQAKTLTISADKYPDNFEIFADTMIRSQNGDDEFVQIHYLNLKPKSQFTLTLDASNITTLSVEFDVLKDSGSSDMAEYTIYE